MSEYPRPTSSEEFDKNFAQKKPLMNRTEAHMESSRCLFCYDPPCQQACPTGIDIPLFIKQIHTNNVAGAAKTIYDSNWMGNACGKVCPTQVLCEGACVYNNQDVKPIEIGRLQNFATLSVIRADKKLYNKAAPNGRKVAVIGAGPAGISCACELSLLGYDVHIFEKTEQASGLTVHGTAPYKIANEEALAEMKYLQDQFGYTIHYNTTIETKEQIQKLESDYEAIFIGVGNGPTSRLGIEGEDLEGVIGAVEFISELRARKHLINMPRTVVVLGGGNTAMDAASESARMGAENVFLSYRRAKDEMGAYWFEYDLAIGAGVKSMFNTSPKRILGEGRVTGIEFVKTTLLNDRIVEVPGSEFIMECDMVIKATGQAKMLSLFQHIEGLEVDASRRVVVDLATYQTTNPKYFAGGDAVNGGAEVVNAAFEGKRAALGMHGWMQERSAEVLIS
jgi:dihydropyrimidine dehydrogenase (NAD+) subunit PreT